MSERNSINVLLKHSTTARNAKVRSAGRIGDSGNVFNGLGKSPRVPQSS